MPLAPGAPAQLAWLGLGSWGALDVSEPWISIISSTPGSQPPIGHATSLYLKCISCYLCPQGQGDDGQTWRTAIKSPGAPLRWRGGASVPCGVAMGRGLSLSGSFKGQRYCVPGLSSQRCRDSGKIICALPDCNHPMYAATKRLKYGQGE